MRSTRHPDRAPARAALSLAAAGLAVGLLALAARAAGTEPDPERAGTHAEDEELALAREARALLADRCFACHGPDDRARARTGGLRLDQRAPALDPSAGAAAIVPGDPAASELLRRVTADSERRRMPPPDAKLGRLDREEVALLERWIAAGAPYVPHWSFVPPDAPALPATADADWIRDPVDAFVLARLQADGLEPAPPADRSTWARRAALDLTGLPPDPRALARLTAAADGDEAAARAAFVDTLLASPAFGEHQALPWLDLARYADTHGYQNDRARAVWPWRDWLVRAWNEDLPYDAFVHRLLAGDLLPDATRDDRLATAFLRLHRQTNEGGSVEEEFRQEYVADRVDTLGTTFLGLTLECARCHDHKYDPIDQRDYYALAAIVDDIDESGLYSHFTDATPTPKLLLPSDEQERQLDALERELAALEERLTAVAEREREAFEVWCEQDAGSAARARPALQARYGFDPAGDVDVLANALAPEERVRFGSGVQTVQGERANDGALAFQGDDEVRVPRVGAFARWDPFALQVRLRVDALRERMVVLHRSRAWHDAGSQGYELLLEDGRPSAALIHFWPGDALRVRAREPIEAGRWTTLALTYDGSSRAEGLRLFVDGRPVAVDVVRDGLVQGIRGGGPGELSLGARFRDRGLAGGRITRLTVADRALTPLAMAALAHAAAGTEGAGPLARALADRDPADAELRAWWLANESAAWRAASEELRAARRQLGELVDGVRSIMVMEERPTPRPAFVLERGRYDRPGEPVEPGVPPALGGALAGDDRLALARWLTDPQHPLTARVEVDRLWRSLFGTGLVATPEDWGVQGSAPSHPALLDHLATAFVRDGWSRKRLLRRLVLSATYAQSSRVSAEARTLDPDARLLSRYPRRRLSAEALRDGALAAAGLLRPRNGGPPVKPYQPAGLWREKSGQTYVPSEGDDLWRRSLYTFWKRTSPPPTMMLFDASKRDRCVARRQDTTTPLQALVLWNDPQFVEAARVLGRRAYEAGADDEARLDALAKRLLLVLDRDDRDTLLELLDTLEGEQAQDPAGTLALLAVGAAPSWSGDDAGPEPARRAAWALVASTLLSHPDVVEVR